MRRYVYAFLVTVVVLAENLPALAQSQDENTYDWLTSSPDGDWTGSGSRWQAPGGGSIGGPTSNRILRLNNNHYPTMNNNVSSGFQIYQLQFAAGSSSNRTISGNSVVFNPESNLGNTVKIENFSTATHTVNLAISRGSGSGDLQLNPVTGKLIFGSTINNGGKEINIWGDNLNSLELNGVISGSGAFNIRRSTIVKFGAANTYTGSTVVYQGELWIMANGSISSSSSIWLGDNCCPSSVTKLFLADEDGGQTFSNQINFNYGNEGSQVLGGLNSSGTNTFSSNNISISSGETLTIEQVNSGGTLEFNNGISGAGSIKLIGSGTTVFTGANSYTGGTTVNGGTLRLNRTGGTTLPANHNVTVSAGTLKISTDQELNNLTVTSGSLVIDAGATLTVSGSFTGGGTITNNGTIIVKGSSTFPGATTTVSAMNNLEINRSAGVILNKDMTVTGTLTLTSGVLDVSTTTLTVSGTISGATSANYIKTSSTGGLKQSVSTSAVAFPVGNSAYNPITLTNNTGAADNFTVRVIDEVYANGTSSGSVVSTLRVQRTWDIAKATPSANAGTGVDMVFNWTPASHTSGTLSIPKLYHYETSSWVKKSITTNTTYDVVAGTLTFTGYKGDFSPFAIMDDGTALPVTWQSFTAEKQGTASFLKWSTASEQNTKDFEVQHSTNTLSWTPLGLVMAAGNSTTARQYSFTHATPFKGNVYNYYRILQRDLDGKLSYSKIASLIYDEPGPDVFVYPNPATGAVTVYLAESQDVRLINVVGATVWKGTLSAGRNQIPLTHLAKGVYWVVTGSVKKQLLIQ
jgi:autotransporter-associated beta strand protein